MTTTCDLSVDWNRCAYCSELRDRVQSASDLRLACSQRLDQAWDEYRSERERGVVAFGTVTHRAWQARIDNLDRQLLAADAAAGRPSTSGRTASTSTTAAMRRDSRRPRAASRPRRRRWPQSARMPRSTRS